MFWKELRTRRYTLSMRDLFHVTQHDSLVKWEIMTMVKDCHHHKLVTNTFLVAPELDPKLVSCVKSVSTRAPGSRATCHLTDFNETLLFKGSTPKFQKTNWSLFWFFPGGDRPPPWFFLVFTKEIALKWVKRMKFSLRWYSTNYSVGLHTYFYILS